MKYDMNKKRGVTLITLVIVIILMTLLLTVVVTNGTSIYNDAKLTKLQSEMKQIELLANNYVTRNSGIDFEEVELDISTYTESEKEQFAGETIVNNKITLYILDLEAIDAKEVNYGTLKDGPKDRYLYSLETKRVYYELGRKIGEETYYRVEK